MSLAVSRAICIVQCTGILHSLHRLALAVQELSALNPTMLLQPVLVRLGKSMELLCEGGALGRKVPLLGLKQRNGQAWCGEGKHCKAKCKR